MPEAERPTIMLVDDDPAVRSAVERDVKRRYGSGYRVLASASGREALDLLGRLHLRGERAALLVADQRMPAMTGTEFLAAAHGTYPDAKRMLLTAYADTDAAIDAINVAAVDYYVLKPWDPPEERLYPVVDELLEEWQATARRTVGGLRVVGDRWSSDSHDVRTFLSRNQVPFRWLEAGRDPEAATVLASVGDARLPLVVLEDGRSLSAPEPHELGEALGMATRSEADAFDLVVVGAGPAGLAAAVYGASEGLSTAVIEADAPGGQAGSSARIENYLGFPQGVSGAELARRALTQAKRFGATIVQPRRVVRLRRNDPYRLVELDDGSTISAGAVVVATGVQYRSLEAPGAERLLGRGVYYGSAAAEFEAVRGERVVVIGGANSAGQAAVHLAGIADRVTLVVRGATLEARMSAYLVEQVRALERIEVLLASEVAEACGGDHLSAIRVRGPYGERTLDAAAVFVFIGARPRTDWLEGMVVRDAQGFLETGAALRAAERWSQDRDPYLLETSVPGVFAVGDVRAQSVKRVASAVGEGSVAIQFVHAYLSW